MPSGFQQDQNQLTPSYYRVVISCGSGGAQWYATGDAPDEFVGRISPYSADSLEALPSTLAYSQALARGNLRFQTIVEAITNLADCQILDVEVDAELTGDAMANNNHIAFTIKFDRDEGVFPAYCAIRKAEGANSDGTVVYDNVVYPAYYTYAENDYTIQNTSNALRDIIWKTLANGRTDRSVRVFHPLEGSDPLTGSGYQEKLTVGRPFNNSWDAFTDIAIQEIDGTTTTLVSTY